MHTFKCFGIHLHSTFTLSPVLLKEKGILAQFLPLSLLLMMPQNKAVWFFSSGTEATKQLVELKQKHE